MTLFHAPTNVDDLLSQSLFLIHLAHPLSTAGGGGGGEDQLLYVLKSLQAYVDTHEDTLCPYDDKRLKTLIQNNYYLNDTTVPTLQTLFDCFFPKDEDEGCEGKQPEPITVGELYFEDEDGNVITTFIHCQDLNEE
jgi:thiamine pyrophosphokinase